MNKTTAHDPHRAKMCVRAHPSLWRRHSAANWHTMRPPVDVKFGKHPHSAARSWHTSPDSRRGAFDLLVWAKALTLEMRIGASSRTGPSHDQAEEKRGVPVSTPEVFLKGARVRAKSMQEPRARGIHKTYICFKQTVVSQSHHYTHQHNLIQVHYHCNQYNK